MAKSVKFKVREQRKPRNMAVVHMFNRGHAVFSNKKAKASKNACRGKI